MRAGEAGGAILEEHLEEAVEERMSQAGKLGEELSPERRAQNT